MPDEAATTPLRLECVARVLLIGARDPASPLSLLKGVARHLLPIICAGHVRRAH